MSIEAMKQALDAFYFSADHPVPWWVKEKQQEAIAALRTAIAEAEKQEPVAQCSYPRCQTSAGCDGACSKALYTAPPAAPVQDEHQAFIDSLPKDGDDKMFMQIDHWARQSYKRHQSSVRGQMITAGDAYESHVIWAALRWAEKNTPPAAQRQPLTREQREVVIAKADQAMDADPNLSWRDALISQTEAAHGITGDKE